MSALTTLVHAPVPFDFHLTVGYQTYFRGSAGADRYTGGIYYRVLRHGERTVVASVRLADTGPRGALEVRAFGDEVTSKDLDHAARTMVWMLGLGVDLPAFYRVLERDPVLRDAVGGLRGLRPPRTESLFEALVMAVIAQQVSSSIARMVREALVASYGTPVAAPEGVLYGFPTPGALLEAGTPGLRALKLSQRKAECIQELCRKSMEGALEGSKLQALADEEEVAELTRVRGVGRWTAEWVLLRALGRVDAFPAGDLALKRVVSEMYFGGRAIDEEVLRRFAAERWYPYRGLVTVYLFAYLRQRRVAREATF